MEKIKLNNQIVLMRKYVKQAKVHSINKLVKQVKLLQNRKGNDVQISKAKRKAERYLEEISLLKKVKPDYVSKLALSKANNWKEVLLKKDSALEDRCIAILANYGPVQKEVEVFHNSNKDLVSKISDLIKQWEEKNKFPKDSPHIKKYDSKKLQGPGGLVSKRTSELKPTDNGNSESFCKKTDSNLLIDNSHKIKKGKIKYKSNINQKLSTSVKPSQKSLLTENISEISPNNEHQEQGRMEIEESVKTENDLLDNNDQNGLKKYIDNNAENQIKSGYGIKSKTDSETEENEDSEDDDPLEDEPEIKRQTKNHCASGSEQDSENESDTEETEGSEDVDFLENALETESSNHRDTGVEKLQLSAVSDIGNLDASCSIPTKLENTGSKSGENKLKEIAVLNLDDFKDLDEIPVSNSAENEESDEEEAATDNDSQNDPFFLGRDEAVSAENKLVDDPKNVQYVSVNEIFERKEKSNDQFNSKKNFQKHSGDSQFSNKYSSEHRIQKDLKTWKNDKFAPKSHQDRFQHKSNASFGTEGSNRRYQPYKPKNFDRNNFKNHKEFDKKNSFDAENSSKKFLPHKLKNFDRDSFKNRKEFRRKTFSETYRNNEQSNSKDFYNRNSDASFKKNNLQKKGDADSKPLHPSWEAKKKQKELINTSFQGKKIVFED